MKRRPGVLGTQRTAVVVLRPVCASPIPPVVEGAQRVIFAIRISVCVCVTQVAALVVAQAKLVTTTVIFMLAKAKLRRSATSPVVHGTAR